jgi:hypothetical protein
MSRLTRILIIGATLATLSLVGTTAVAQAQSSDRPASNQDTRRPATLPTATEDPRGQLAQRKALYQSERERTLARHRALGALGMQRLAAQRKALYQSQLDTTLARHRALGTLAAQPAATIRPAAPGPGVDVLATLLVGLVGGLLGGAAAMAGWTATTRRRADRPATGS